MTFTEDLIDRLATKRKHIERTNRRRAKQMHRAAQETLRAEEQEERRERRIAKFAFIDL